VYFKRQAASRLVPYLFFSTLLILPTFWHTDFTAGLRLPSLEGYVKGIGATLFAGFPYFNIPVWFLVCLFVVEIIHYWTARYLRSSSRVLLIAFGFYLTGSILAWNAAFLNPMNMLAPHGKIYPYFMILEAFTAYSLYLVGFYMRRSNFLMGALELKKALPAIAGCAVLLLLTFDLNKAMFRIPSYDAVIMVASSHGNPILFPLTAVIGSIMVILLAKLSVGITPLSFLGAQTMTIFCLNGIFYHFINDRLARWLLAHHGGTAFDILVSGAVVSAASLVVTIPFVFLGNRFVPQLIGKPKINGPVLPRLVS
jgi:acyltransferase